MLLRILYLFGLICSVQFLSAQCERTDYQEIIRLAKEDLQNRIYQRAINRLLDARDICPDEKDAVNVLIKQAFEQIEEEKQATIEATKNLYVLYRRTLADTVAKKALDETLDDTLRASLGMAALHLKKEGEASYFTQDIYDALAHSAQVYAPASIRFAGEVILADPHTGLIVILKQNKKDFSLPYNSTSRLSVCALSDTLTTVVSGLPFYEQLGQTKVAISNNADWLLSSPYIAHPEDTQSKDPNSNLQSYFVRAYQLNQPSSVLPLLYDFDGGTIAHILPVGRDDASLIVGENGTVRMLQAQQLRSATPARELVLPSKTIPVLYQEQDNQLFMRKVGGSELLIQSLDQDSTLLTKPCVPHKIGMVYELSEDNRWLAIGDSKGSIFIWDLEKDTLSYTLTQHTQEIKQLHFSKSGKQLFSLGAEGVIYSWYFFEAEPPQAIKLTEDRQLKHFFLTDHEEYLIAIQSDTQSSTPTSLISWIPIHFDQMEKIICESYKPRLSKEAWQLHIAKDLGTYIEFHCSETK